MGRLDNKVAIITAAGSGMGRASALLFAQEGAKVVVDDIDSEKGEQVVGEIKQVQGEATFFKGDVTKIGEMKTLVEVTLETYGKIDIVFNHAGGPGPFGIDGVSESDWQRCIDLNTKGAFFLTQFAVPEMRKIGSGAVLFTSSILGLVGATSSPLYCMVKGGIVNMTRSLALVLAPDNIRVNCICPGGIMTPMTPEFLPAATEEEKQAMLNQWTTILPLGRWADPSEFAAAALFLVSSEASFVTGAVLPVDAGYTAR